MAESSAHIRDTLAAFEAKRRSLFQRIVDDRMLHLMILPSFVVVVGLSYMAMYGVIIAFKNFNVLKGFFDSPWARSNGFEHFIDFFRSPAAAMTIKNTILIAVLKLAILSPPPVILALLVNEMRHPGFKKLTQTISYLPHFVAWVVVAGMIQVFLDVNYGPVNQFLLQLGWIKEPVFFLADNRLFRPMLIVTDLWKSIGWGSIIYLGVIATIDLSLYESAAIDGANRFQQAIHITWPHLLKIFMILFILHCGRIMQGLGATFQQCYILGNDLNREVSDIIDTYIVRIGLDMGRFSFATAVGLFKSVINLALLLLSNFLSKKFTGKGLFLGVAVMMNTLRLTRKEKVFNLFVVYLPVTLLSISIIYPFWYMFINSFNKGLSHYWEYFIVRSFTLENYRYVFNDPYLLGGFFITIARTLVGIVITVFNCAMCAFALRKRALSLRAFYLVIFTIPMFFGGGLIPFYLALKFWGLLDTFWVYIIPTIFSFFYVIILMASMNDLSDSLEDSAKIDGAGFFTIFLKIYFPLSLPILAVIALFVGVTQWKSWFDTVYYTRSRHLVTLPAILIRIIRKANYEGYAGLKEKQYEESIRATFRFMDPEGVKLATMFVTILPILAIYPFLQRYFVKGLMIGSLKE